MHDDVASAENLAALRAALLRCHEHSVRMEPPIHSLLMVRRLKRLHLSWLMIPWFLVLAVRSFLTRYWRESFADEERTVRLYRRLSGKDPQVARAEVGRIGHQLRELDERLRDLDERLRDLGEQWPGTSQGADPAELEAAAAALVGYYLAGRRSDDELLGEVEAAWASTRSSSSSSWSVPSSGGGGGFAASWIPRATTRFGRRPRPIAIARRGGAGWTSGPGEVAMDEQALARSAELIARDLAATLGWETGRARTEARTVLEHRAGLLPAGSAWDDLDRATQRELLEELVVEAVEELQQRLHDTFVDTSWPSCVRHPHHPMWLGEGRDGGIVWCCSRDHAEIAPLGMLGSIGSPDQHP